MLDLVNRLFRLQRGEWPRLLQFGLFGFLLQMGMGVGFSAGDAAFLSNVGADSLPLVFMLTPLVMLVYTGLFSYLLVRFSIDRMVDVTLAALVLGGGALWALIASDLPPEWDKALYFGLKLYLAMWYIALYSLFWNYTDAYFDIQDAKRLFPIFAAFCALGTASGALLVSVLAAMVPMHYFFLGWAGLALAAVPLARSLRRRWQQIAEHDADLDEDVGGAAAQFAAVGKAFGRSRYTIVFTATLFITLLMTNLAEYQYSMVLQEGRSEAELAALFGTLYAAANVFNLVTCLFVFNRLVARLGVRNVAFIQPLTYFAVFGYFFLEGGTAAAIAAFFAYHGVLTSIEYNNQNLLFNAVPSRVKRPLRTVMEGLCEPLASFVAGGFLLYAASHLDMRELSGIGVIVGAALIAVVVALRHLYPAAMAANMRQGWMNFGDARQLPDEASGRSQNAPARPAPVTLDRHMAGLESGDPARRAAAIAGIAATATRQDIHILAPLTDCLPRLAGEERRKIIALLGNICDSEAIPGILRVASELAPRDRRAVTTLLTGIGETAIPRLNEGLRDRASGCRSRAIAARALASISYAQFASQSPRLVDDELREARRLHADAQVLGQSGERSPALALLARAMRERVAASVDFVLELLAIGGKLPNFDLLIVSLHSANPKVRGNAIETVESGIEARLFRLLEPLLQTDPLTGARPQSTPPDLTVLLDAALDSSRPIEVAAALHLLHERLDTAAFALRAQRVTAPDMPPLVRRHLLAVMGFDEDSGPDPFSILIALARHPDIGTATLEALAALAEHALALSPAEPALHAHACERPFWISESALAEVTARYPDLALVMLKSRDGRQYAA